MSSPLLASQLDDLMLAQPSNQLSSLQEGYRRPFLCVDTQEYDFPEGLVGLSEIKKIEVKTFLRDLRLRGGVPIHQLKTTAYGGASFLAVPYEITTIAAQLKSFFDRALAQLSWSAGDVNWILLLQAQQSDTKAPSIMRASCRGPIALNKKQMVGVQAVLHDPAVPRYQDVGTFTNHL